MIQIRKNVFETNSSSSHSLAFSNENRGYNYDLPVDEKGVLTIQFGKYGWGPDILKTPIEKLRYWLTDNFGGYTDETWEEAEKRLLEDERISHIVDFLKQHCPGVKEVKFIPYDLSDKEYYMLGYVDHDSVGTSNNVDFEELIFNNSIVILIDNDNSIFFNAYLDTSMYNPDYRPGIIEELFDKPVEEVLHKFY